MLRITKEAELRYPRDSWIVFGRGKMADRGDIHMKPNQTRPADHASESGLPMKKYHVALSFAGEDRAYVERVAKHLDSQGVLVFYDKFEEATLWGKNLYTHLRDVYENKALFTVMFISQHYREKLWPRHELESAQARALSSKQEYILPAFFDESIEVPGLLKTFPQQKLWVDSGSGSRPKV
jgi:hypothetical protein